MQITWRERLIQCPELRDFNNWPIITADQVQKRNRRDFFRNQRIIQEVLKKTSLVTVAKRYQVSRGRISQLLDRSLGGDEHSSPPLTTGLVPHTLLRGKQRRSPFPENSKTSCSCAFKQLLVELPALVEALDATIEAKLADSPSAQRLTPQALHGEFKRMLRALHWPRDRYPYTHATCAYSSVRRYLYKRIDEMAQVRQAKANITPRALSSSQGVQYALDTIQIDEHHIDVSSRVCLSLNDQLIPLRMGYVSVLVAVDIATKCILGYHLAPTKSPNQQDMLALLVDCITPWKPRKLHSAGLSYLPGPCFPSALPGGLPISFGTVQLDNALLHRALSVKSALCELFGAALNYGLPALPQIRSLIESSFDYFESHAGHRFASTRGSHPKDPIRESVKNRRKPPKLTYQSLDEVLSVMFSEFNRTPKSELGGATPLELFQYQCERLYIRYIPEVITGQWNLFQGTTERPLHWYKHENRLPHVNFANTRYQGAGLLMIAAREKRIRLVFDRRDVRTVQAFTLDGTAIGTLYATPRWQSFPHSLATRNMIVKNNREYHLKMRNPLTEFFAIQLQRKDTLDGTNMLVRLYYEFSQDGRSELILAPDLAPVTVHSHPKNSPHWTPAMANHRR